MDIRFNTGELREIIHKYYEKNEGVNASANFSPQVENDRGGEKCVEQFRLYKSIEVLGKEKIIKESFEETDYQVSEVTLDAGVEYDWEGYGMAERRIARPYFNGVVVKIEKVRVKKMNR